MPAAAGVAVGLLLAFVLWLYLFSAPFSDAAPPRYPTAEAATPAAVDAGGRYRWPGTTVEVNEVDAQRVDVERRWLGIRESVVRVQQTPAGWDMGSAKAGPAHALQVFLACVIPAAVAGYLVVTTVRRRTASRRRATPEPG